MGSTACRAPSGSKWTTARHLKPLAFGLASLAAGCVPEAGLDMETGLLPREAPEVRAAFSSGPKGVFAPPNRVGGVVNVFVDATGPGGSPRVDIGAGVGVGLTQVQQTKRAERTLWEGSLDFRSVEDGPIDVQITVESVDGIKTQMRSTLIVDQSPPELDVQGPAQLPASLRGQIEVRLSDGFPADQLDVNWQVERLGALGPIQSLRGAATLTLVLDPTMVALEMGAPLPPAVTVIVRASDPMGNTTERRVRLPVSGGSGLPDVRIIPLLDEGAAVPLDRLKPDDRSFRRLFREGVQVARFEISNPGTQPLRLRGISDLPALVEYSVGPWMVGLSTADLERLRVDPRGEPVGGSGPLEVDFNAICWGGRQVLLDPRFWVFEGNLVDVFGGVCEPEAASEARSFSRVAIVRPGLEDWTELAPGESIELSFEIASAPIEPALESLLDQGVRGLNARRLQSGFAAVAVKANENCAVCEQSGCQLGPVCQAADVYFGERLEAVLAVGVRFDWASQDLQSRFGLEIDTAEGLRSVSLERPENHAVISAVLSQPELMAR